MSQILEPIVFASVLSDYHCSSYVQYFYICLKFVMLGIFVILLFYFFVIFNNIYCYKLFHLVSYLVIVMF